MHRFRGLGGMHPVVGIVTMELCIGCVVPGGQEQVGRRYFKVIT